MKVDIPDLANTQADIFETIAYASTARRIILCPTYYSTDPNLEKVFGSMPDRYWEVLGERIDLRLGSATELPFEAGSFDKVHALECAFHFDTRERFFDEALRVLRPGGRLATADMLPNVGDDPDSFINRLGLRRWGVPWANIYDRNVYADKLRAHGFVDVRVESIRNHVFPGIGKYSAARNAGKRMDEIEIELSQEEIDSCAGAQTWRTMAASTIT